MIDPLHNLRGMTVSEVRLRPVLAVAYSRFGFLRFDPAGKRQRPAFDSDAHAGSKGAGRVGPSH